MTATRSGESYLENPARRSRNRMTARGARKGPPTFWYLGNVDGPQCHANQVGPATGLVDDAITPHERKAL